MKKFIKLIKDKWLRETSLTILLVALILIVFIAVNTIFDKLDLKPIDFTKEKIYSLSEDSKNEVKDIEQNVTMYFFGYTEDSTPVVLGKQYHDVNDKITVQLVNKTERPDLVSQFGLDEDDQLVAVSSNQRYKIISSSDMYSSDYSSSSTVDLTEQKLTNAIINVTTASKPQVYFLTGHGEYGIDSSSEMYSFAQGIVNEIMDVSTLDLLTSDMPKICDVLIIANPVTDFSDIEVQKIINYINNGGNIMWMQDPYINIKDYSENSFPNMQKVLDQYGISFSYGVVCEQNGDNAIASAPGITIPNLSYNSIIKDLYTDGKVVMPYAGRITNVETEKFLELGVSEGKFITSTDTSYYKKDVDSSSYFTKSSSDETGSFIMGETLHKKIGENKYSILAAYSSAMFATNFQIPIDIQNYIVPIALRNNRDLALNTVAYLANREDSIRIRKDTGVVNFESATEAQAHMVMSIIFLLPIVIIIVGIILSIIRKRRK